MPADVPAGLALCPSCLLGAAIAEPAIPEDPLLNAAPPEHGELLSAAAAEATEPIAERHQDGSLPHISSRYRVLQRIAEGGMGVVYKAEQRSPVRRTVAIKLIKLGMDTRQVIARFESERQALAMLNHPNVAAVYDAGATNTGRPYFVMEWLAGEPITEFCDRHNYTTRQRLQLFIQACDAIQHAHQKAIIHRDIKPSNLLVTLDGDKPLVKVIDFGVAKATAHRLTEQTMFTEQGQLIGTPEYMSPEQAEMNALDIDTRTDIYSLGVVLYELLTGAVPFDSKTFREARLTGGIDEQAKRVWAAVRERAGDDEFTRNAAAVWAGIRESDAGGRLRLLAELGYVLETQEHKGNRPAKFKDRGRCTARRARSRRRSPHRR